MEGKKFERNNIDYWLAQSALYWIEGRLKEAEEAWQKADAAAQKLPQFGSYEFDRMRCALLRKEFDHPSDRASRAGCTGLSSCLNTSRSGYPVRPVRPSLPSCARLQPPKLPSLFLPPRKTMRASIPYSSCELLRSKICATDPLWRR